jgi:FkbH-like protein
MNNDNDVPLVNAVPAPYGQVAQLLIREDLDCWKDHSDCTVIWTRPESIISSFNKVLSYSPYSVKDILDEVDQYASLLLDTCRKTRFVFVPAWTVPTYNRGLGMMNMKKNTGIANVLMQMNLRLADALDNNSNIILLDAQRWVHAAGKHAYSPRLWYRGKIAFGNDVYKEAVKDIKSALRGLSGHARKIIILDLDDTIWGGIVGDDGWENLVLGGHDPIGEAFVDFQHALKSLTNRGVLLGIVSKNEESIGLEAIRSHPEMVLRLDDFAGWRINWQDKASNIIDLVSDLNIGLQSAVFIDDNPRERARVRDALPEVMVPDWPEDFMLYKSTLLNMNCFDTPSISKEDAKRSEMYMSEKKRKDLKSSLGSVDDWLKGLETKIKVEKLNSGNLQRTTQLLNKTNQMNLTTRRMSESELVDWTKGENRRLWTFRVSDKLGDSGLTGIISIEVQNKIGLITDFILSCRVMGRMVEETMIYTVAQFAKESGLDELRAVYIATPKNKPCLEFFQRSGFDFHKSTQSYSWKLKKEYTMPDYIEVCCPESL